MLKNLFRKQPEAPAQEQCSGAKRCKGHVIRHCSHPRCKKPLCEEHSWQRWSSGRWYCEEHWA